MGPTGAGERLATPGFLAEARHRLATALLARSAAGDLDEAARLAVAAQRTFAALGFGIFQPASDALVARLGDGRSGPLSAREEEVAALVSEGLTNREIARRLVISERTAQNHVQHILTKLGFASRSQIAAWKVRDLR